MNKPFVKRYYNFTENIILRNFNMAELKILLLIERLSIGIGSPYALIPQYKDFAVTGISRNNIKDTLKKLIGNNVILKKTLDGKDYYSINNLYGDWNINFTEVYSKSSTKLIDAYNIIIAQNVNMACNKELENNRIRHNKILSEIITVKST